MSALETLAQEAAAEAVRLWRTQPAGLGEQPPAPDHTLCYRGLLTELGRRDSITDRDPGDESGLATSAAQAISDDVLMGSQIAALISERDFWRGNYENMKRMRDALLPDDERPKPNPFANALKHSVQPIGLVR